MLPRLLDHHGRDGLEHELGRGFDWGRDEVPREVDSARSDDFLNPPRAPRQAARSWPLDGDEDPAHTVFYRVGEKETLEDVSRMFGLSKDEIIEANYLDPTARLQKGMLLALNVRGDVMARIAKKRAAARLEKQEEAEDTLAAAPDPRGVDAKRPRPRADAKHPSSYPKGGEGLLARPSPDAKPGSGEPQFARPRGEGK
jgi:hypothetical protein